MCCRYYIGDNDTDRVLENWLAEARQRSQAMGLPLMSSGEVRPRDIAPVIAPNSKNRAPGAFPMKWGFTHPERNILIFNTRSETARDIPLFAGSAAQRRCVIPASRYFEWKKEGRDKIKYAVESGGGPLYMAGLYFRLPAERLPCFSVLTMEAHGAPAEIHGRMPVLLPESAAADWLSAGRDYGAALSLAAGMDAPRLYVAPA